MLHRRPMSRCYVPPCFIQFFPRISVTPKADVAIAPKWFLKLPLMVRNQSPLQMCLNSNRIPKRDGTTICQVCWKMHWKRSRVDSIEEGERKNWQFLVPYCELILYWPMKNVRLHFGSLAIQQTNIPDVFM